MVPQALASVAVALLMSACVGCLVLALLRARETRVVSDYLDRTLNDLCLTRRDSQALSTSLEEARGRMREMENLATIGRLAVGVCHDLNNPLAYVSNNLEVVEEALETLSAGPGMILEPTGPQSRLAAWASSDDVEAALEDAPEALKDALEGCRRIRDLCAGMKSLVRRDVEQVPMSLATIAAESVRIAGAGLQGVRIRSHLEDPLPVMCAPGEIVRVITNLIVNAGQACGRKGVVTVAGWREGRDAVIEVADNGPGVPAEVKNKVFEPFFTTKAPGEGTGLGLAISHDIVSRHGGALLLHSTPGQGTRLQVRLALDPSVEEASTAILLHAWRASRDQVIGEVA